MNQTPPCPTSEVATPGRTSLRLGSLVVVAAVILAVLPHLVRWIRTGDATWLCDTDELVPYGQIISHAYHRHPWKLGDPALPEGGACMYPWIQIVPFTLLSKALGTGPTGVFALMRVFAGVSTGIGFLLLFRQMGRPRTGVILAAFAASDQGSIPLVSHWLAIAGIAAGNPPEALHEWAAVLHRYRLITPGLSFLSLATSMAALMHLRTNWTRRSIWIAGLAFGYCIHTYFYYWTAVAGCIAGLTLLEYRHWKAYAGVAVIGAVVGSPTLAANFLTKAQYGDEWLVRNEYFVQIADASLALPKKALLLHAIAGWVVFRWQRQLLPLWVTGSAALVLSISHSITGLYIQPWHWAGVYGMASNVIMLTQAAIMLSQRLPRSKWVHATLVAAAVAHWTGAAFLRTWATDHNRESAAIEARRQSWLAFRSASPAFEPEPNAVIAGDTRLSDWAVVLDALRPLTGAVGLSPSVRNDDWLRRRVLNAYLKGLPADQVADSAYGEYGVWFQHAFMTPEALRAEKDEFNRVWTEIARDPEPDLQRYRVRYLILPSTSTPPAPVREKWELQANAAGWQVWRRKTP